MTTPIPDDGCDHDPVERAFERAPWCILIPAMSLPQGHELEAVAWADPDIIGPFSTFEEAKAFVVRYPERCKRCDLRLMSTPETEALCVEEAELGRRFQEEAHHTVTRWFGPV
jgi:hypothetical protein